MIDINLLRADPEKVKNSLKIKNYDLDSDLFIEIESKRKTFQTEVEDLKGLKNKLSKDFGELKRNNQDTSELSNQLEEIKKNLSEKEELLNKTLSQLSNFLLDIPNIPHQDVEAGDSEEDNKVIKTFGNVQKKDSIDHLEITSDIDTESAVKLAGTRFAVLKDVSKTLVYELSKYRNGLNEVIPERIITRPPSAELAPDQKDSDSLPDYEILDPIIELYVEKDFSVKEIIQEGFDEKTVEKIIGLIDFNEYKRRQAPLGVKISDRNFDKGRRYPITNLWKPNM